ncbi:Chaperone DnaJ C-terminal domain-containing protein [Entamoeba marina]
MQLDYNYSSIQLLNPSINIPSNVPVQTLIIAPHHEPQITISLTQQITNVRQVVVNCSLAQLYNGTTLYFDTNIQSFVHERSADSIDVVIERGTQDNDIIVYELPFEKYFFTVHQLPHDVYLRIGNDLYCSLFTQKNGTYNLPLLDGGYKQLQLDGMNNHSLVILKSLGMPYKDTESFGDIHITFLIFHDMQIFPSLSSYECNNALRRRRDNTDRCPTRFIHVQKKSVNEVIQIELIQKDIIDEPNNIRIRIEKAYYLPHHPTTPYFVCFKKEGNENENTMTGDLVFHVIQ